jgi:HPt (histidine-containing phosphotransfer) domain-containing protein
LRRKTHTAALNGEAGISKNDRQRFTKLLASYEIDFDKGLFYLSEDWEQYTRFAEFFIERYAQGKRETEDIFTRRDWPALKLKIHSLKSRARNMGAWDLYQSAERLERYCAEGKTAFVEKALPLLFLQWEEARNGLAIFVEWSYAEHPLEKVRRDKTVSPSIDAMAAELLDHVRNMRLTGARKILRELLAGAHGEEKALLEAIQEKIREADYGEAERLVERFFLAAPSSLEGERSEKPV